MSDEGRLNTFLSEQSYMTIAVTRDDGTAWALPVRIQQRNGWTFEWFSKLDTVHSQAIAKRPHIAISIWTPESETTEQFGFYAEATAELLSDRDGSGRYQATVTQAWVNDARHVKRPVAL